MRKFLFFIFLAHAGLHIPGFLKGFQFVELYRLTIPVSPQMGLMWLLSALLFLTAGILLVFYNPKWSWLALAGVILSQFLIIYFWQDARWGTVINIIILILGLQLIGEMRFRKLVSSEISKLIKSFPEEEKKLLFRKDIEHLPPIVQTWLQNSGSLGRPKIVSARLRQTGRMKSEPHGRWMPFTAEQYVNVDSPAFVWATRVRTVLRIPLLGRDILEDGKGKMLISLFGHINVVNDQYTPQINSGSMLRFLGEICWFPSAALNEYISWENMEKNKARATFKWKSREVSGIFEFSDTGKIIAFEAERFYGGKLDAKKYLWRVEALSYCEYDGITIPQDSRVIWKLPEGNFHWLQLKITALEFNKPLKHIPPKSQLSTDRFLFS